MMDTPPIADTSRESEIRSHFRDQSEICETMGSPLTASVCRILAEALDRGTATGRRVLDWPGKPRSDAVSLRLVGALHRLVLGGRDRELAAAYPPRPFDGEALRQVVLGAIARHDEELCRALDTPPQTNEIARSAMLYPGLLAVARQTGLPLDIREIGSSAGLNLLFDRFGYDYGGKSAGWEASPVRLAPEIRGLPIPLDGTLEIRSRAGSDIAPVEVTDPAALLRLRSFVWADQTERLRRLDDAVAIAGREPYAMTRADAADFVRDELAARQPGAAFVLFHSIMWQYMPPATRRAIEGALDRAGASATTRAPLAWLRMEPADSAATAATLSMTLWPDCRTRQLARCDYHGRWIEWL
jgi:hypothetical protein